MQPGASRIRAFGTSIFTEMSRLAVEAGAVNLGQGFPDFAGPEWVKRAAADAIAADQNQYAPSPGLLTLREAVAARWQARGWRQVDPASEVTITAGATEALIAATLALVDPGDEVIVFDPAYDAYGSDALMAGGRTRAVMLHPPRSGEQIWWFDQAELAAAITPQARLLLLNSPHNPTGKVFSRAELEGLAELCRRHDLLVVSDEVYDELVFEGQHIPIATLPGMWERTLTINSIGKTFSLTGWKIGYVVGPPALTHALRQSHQFITFAVATPLQAAAAVALREAEARGYYDQLRHEYRARRAALSAALAGAGLPVLPAQGSYFLMADISHLDFADDVAFCRYLTTEVKVAAIPPSVFYSEPARAPRLARFCFAKRMETIAAAAERLHTLRARVLR